MFYVEKPLGYFYMPVTNVPVPKVTPEVTQRLRTDFLKFPLAHRGVVG